VCFTSLAAASRGSRQRPRTYTHPTRPKSCWGRRMHTRNPLPPGMPLWFTLRAAFMYPRRVTLDSPPPAPTNSLRSRLQLGRHRRRRHFVGGGGCWCQGAARGRRPTARCRQGRPSGVESRRGCTSFALVEAKPRASLKASLKTAAVTPSPPEGAAGRGRRDYTGELGSCAGVRDVRSVDGTPCDVACRPQSVCFLLPHEFQV
jgi:hypothetical protein